MATRVCVTMTTRCMVKTKTKTRKKVSCVCVGGRVGCGGRLRGTGGGGYSRWRGLQGQGKDTLYGLGAVFTVLSHAASSRSLAAGILVFSPLICIYLFANISWLNSQIDGLTTELIKYFHNITDLWTVLLVKLDNSQKGSAKINERKQKTKDN